MHTLKSGPIRNMLGRLRWAPAVLLLAAPASGFSRPGNTSGNAFAREVQTVVDTQAGLPQNSVRAVAQGYDHYLWFATEEGFARYDGVHVDSYDRRSIPQLDNNGIRSIAPARDGSIWIATPTSVVHFANGRILSHVHAEGAHSVFCDEQGRVWAGTEAGFFLLSQDGRALQPQAATGTPVLSIATDFHGGSWLLTSRGALHFQNGTAQWIGVPDDKSGVTPSALLGTRDGSLWMARSGELLRWNSGVITTRVSLRAIAPEVKVASLLQDNRGDLWIGLAHHGIARLHDETLSRYTAADGLPSNDVGPLQNDENGNVWVGLNDGGAVELRPGLFQTFGKREGLSDNRVWTTLAASDGSIWAGTNTGGLNHVLPDGRVEQFARSKGFPAGAVVSLFRAADGSMWAGLDTGNLVHVSGHSVRVYPDAASTKSSVNAIVAAPDGDLYLLYNRERGLTRFHQGIFTVEPENVAGRPTFAATASDGSLWIGSDRSGVSHWKGRVLQHYESGSALQSSYVTSVYVEASGFVWVTTDSGLVLIRDGRTHSFGPEQGLFSYTVGSILPDDAGYFWMGSNLGISKVLRQELLDVADGKLATVHSLVYGTADGMRTSECNYGTSPSAYRAGDGRLWFATPEGVASINPGDSQPYSGRPGAVVEALRVDGTPFPLSEQVTLSKGTHDVQVDFTAPDFVAPNHLHFRYMLRGFDHTWVEAGVRRQAFYTHLPSGSYTFLVQAEDGKGWQEPQASLAIVVPPHFWQTGWFVALCSALLAAIGYLTYSLRVYALRSRSRELQDCVVQRTAELQEAIRRAEAAQMKLHEQASRDSLTLLWNRRHIFELLQREARRAEEERLDLCVLMLDVDHFKQINDTVGHMGGDCVLERIAVVLKDQTRDYDYAGRYGGEEFLVILCNCTLEAGLRRSETIRGAIAAMRIEFDGRTIPVTASFGVAEVVQGEGIEHALREADRALYRAKHSGKNRVCSSLDLTPVSENEAWFEQHCGFAT